MQKVRADEERKQNFRAMITLADKKFTQLASPDMPEVLTNDSGTLALGVSNVPYKPADFVGRQLRRRLSGLAGRWIAKADSGKGELSRVDVAGLELRVVLR